MDPTAGFTAVSYTHLTGVQKDLVKYLPAPLVGFDGQKYFFDYETPSNACAVGKVREWYGVAQVVLKAYCWIRSLRCV